ncbi:MAG: DUF1569 domain-containing protein [Saprospiraceae bacterium]|nr:DUF1569 domain-containing protein [Saprospiraceae bacterium]
MTIKTLFTASDYESILNRVESLQPDSPRQWGKMDIAQMMAHCSVPLEQATGRTPFKDESNFLSRTLIRWVVFNSIKKGRFGRNAPTAKSFYITDERQFAFEKERLLSNIKDIYEKSHKGGLMPHPAFGEFTTEQWGQLMHLHLDHHLTQFSC